MTKQDITIYCHCVYYQFIPDSVKDKVLNALKSSGVEFEGVADLCRMCAGRYPELRRWAQHKSIRIVACYPRAIKWLFHTAGAPLPDKGVEFLNMRYDSAEKIISLLSETSTVEKEGNLRLEKTGQWVPWFPVIDYDRCVNCEQCLNFCLFGVYELSEQGRVEVRNPANCKTNCPACARVCPNSAIIFPKYSESPINGDEVSQDMSKGQEKLDISKLSEVNVYDAIRGRSKGTKRFSGKADQGQSAAVEQESATLKELQKKLDIPSDVLASLSFAKIADIKANMDKKGRANTQQSPSNKEGKKLDE